MRMMAVWCLALLAGAMSLSACSSPDVSLKEELTPEQQQTREEMERMHQEILQQQQQHLAPPPPPQ